VLAGSSYLVNSLSRFLAPALNAKAARFLAIPAMTELALALWLAIKRGEAAERAQASRRTCMSTPPARHRLRGCPHSGPDLWRHGGCSSSRT
jgi:hypothetical protein